MTPAIEQALSVYAMHVSLIGNYLWTGILAAAFLLVSTAIISGLVIGFPGNVKQRGNCLALAIGFFVSGVFCLFSGLLGAYADRQEVGKIKTVLSSPEWVVCKAEMSPDGRFKLIVLGTPGKPRKFRVFGRTAIATPSTEGVAIYGDLLRIIMADSELAKEIRSKANGSK